MNPETQQLLERIESLERSGRTRTAVAAFAIVLALAAVALVMARSRASASTPSEDRVRYSIVEANRFLLRDAAGEVRGGLEVDGQGTIKLVLGSGYGERGAAFLMVQPNGDPSLALHGKDGVVRAALTGSAQPALVLSEQDAGSSGAVITAREGTGSLALTNAQGRNRFRAP